MTPTPQDSDPSSLPLDALGTALEQSHDVKAKVEAVADDLASANDVAKDLMAEGATTLPAAEVLETGLAVAIKPNIGIALFPDHGSSAGLLISRADAAMYRAKQLRSPFELFEAQAVAQTLQT